MEQLIKTRFTDPEWEKSLKIAFEQITQEIELSGETNGKLNFPLPVGDTMNVYFAPFFYLGQQLIDENNSRYQYQTTCYEVSEHEQAAAVEVRGIDNEINRVRSALIPVNCELKNLLPPDTRKKIIKTRLEILAVCVLDAVMVITVYTAYGYSLIESILMGILFGVFLSLLAHVTPFYINKGKTTLQKRIIAGSFLMALTVLFAFFSFTRAKLFATINHQNPIGANASPWPFVIMSDLAFIVAVGLYLKGMPNKAERETAKRYEQLVSERNRLEAKEDALQQQKKTIARYNLQRRVSNGSEIVYARSTEQRIVHFILQEYGHWKNVDLRYRTDHQRPDCYNHLFPFQFKLYFNNVNND
jgi:hypothetical protein